MGVKPMGTFLTMFFGAIAAMFAKKTSANASPDNPNPQLPPAPNNTNYTLATWKPFVDALVPEGIIRQFVMGWIRVESGGNPCAIGEPGAKGPDGHPREQGLAQLWNPDDLKLVGVASGEFRKYCQPGTQHCTRPLTQQEMARQVRATYGKVLDSIGYARRVLQANQAIDLPGWHPRDSGYWKLVKTAHGLPGVTLGFYRVTRKLGRPPVDWSEFRQEVLVNKVALDSGTERYRKKFGAIFDNAEDTVADINFTPSVV